jgi:hypothetical protein
VTGLCGLGRDENRLICTVGETADRDPWRHT